MAERQFRFRLPWLSSATRPTAEPQSQPEIQAPARPTTPVVPIQRPPFRPAGIAPLQPPPVQAQPQRTEPQPTPPTRQTISQPASPTRATTQVRASSVPPSPRRVITESRLTSQPTSPPRATSQTWSPSRVAPPSRASSVPPSPTRAISQQPQSQRVGQKSPKTSPSKIPRQEQSAVSERPSPAKKLLDTTKDVSATQQEEPKAQPVQPTGPMTEPEAVKKITEAEEPKKLNENFKTEEPKADETKKIIAAESSAGSQGKESEGAAVHGERRRKGEHIKTVSSTHARARHSIIDSNERTFISNGEQVPLHKEIKEDISKLIRKVGTIQSNHPMDEKQVSVITLAGENRGATMHVGSESAKKEESVHIHRGYKTNPDESTEGTTTDGEASSGGRRSKDALKEEPATKAYINSNIQSVNNSILFDSKVSENDPGVHLELSRNPAEPATPKPEPVTRKAEFSITPAQKLTYEPTVRRRCLRGLFLEPSDDELDNPEKPRRHGCRFTCGENSKDKDIGIF